MVAAGSCWVAGFLIASLGIMTGQLWLVYFGYGFVGGIGYWPHFVILNMVGALLGRYYFEHRFGEGRWRAYTPILLAGYSCGMGLVGMSSIAVALISKAVSSIVF